MAKQNQSQNPADRAARHAARERDFGRYDFVKMAPLMGGISLLLTILAIVLLLTKGLNYGIDFAGGTEVQLRFPQATDVGQLRAVVEGTGLHNPSVQSFGTDRDFLIKLESPTGANEKEINAKINQSVANLRTELKAKLGLPDDGVLRVDTVGPQVGSELKRNGVLAAFYSFLVILIYVAVRFDYSYAPGAVLSLAHDSLLTLGVFSILGREFNVQIMAAILTLIGYSLNDTIVTFDRIRETAPKNRDMSLKFIINKAINDMLGRTILTAWMTMLAVVALYFWGGGVISEIAFCLIVGIIFGCYSSIYVAAPLILVMEKFKPSRAEPKAA